MSRGSNAQRLGKTALARINTSAIFFGLSIPADHWGALGCGQNFFFQLCLSHHFGAPTDRNADQRLVDITWIGWEVSQF